MTSNEARKVRIFCICGQKMKVSPEMYGRPGKCVRCRQKIRIPREDELPEDATRIELREHPEFLRKTQLRPVQIQVHDESAEPDIAQDEDAESEGAVAVPLTSLEPLQILCSLDYRCKRELALLEKMSETDEPDGSAEAAASQEQRLRETQDIVREARGALNEELRQRLMEVAIELSSTVEKIAEESLSVRVGETGFWAYRGRVAKLRRRRDSLERRQEDLRGWIATKDPHQAGGYIDADIKDVPRVDARLPLPTDADEDQTLIDRHVRGLREGFAAREEAEQKLASLAGESGALDASAAKEQHARYSAALTRAKAQVQFRRERLDQLRHDYEHDLQCLDAQLDLLRGRLQVGEVTRGQFNSQERAFVQARGDLAKALDVVKRALSANRPQDLPVVRGTFLRRLDAASPARGHSAAGQITASAAAAAMLLALFLPVLAGQSPAGLLIRGTMGFDPFVVALPLVPALAAAAAFGVSLVRRPEARAALYALVCACACLIWALAVHEAAYAVAGAGLAPFRDAGAIPPLGGLVFGAALLALAAAAFLDSARTPRDLALLGGLAVLVFAGLGLIMTDFAGLFSPAPRLEFSVQEQEPGETAAVADVLIANQGLRSMYLAPEPEWPNTYSYRLDRISAGGRRIQMERPVSQRNRLAPGSSVAYSHFLRPGQYAAVLMPPDGAAAASGTFIVPHSEAAPAPAPPMNPAPRSQPPDRARPPQPRRPGADNALGEAGTAPGRGDSVDAPGDAGETTMRPPVILSEPPRLEFGLSGMASGPDREPRFAIGVYPPDGPAKKRSVGLGDEVYDGWYVSEYNSGRHAVTLAHPERDSVIILRVGDRVPLPDEDKEAGSPSR